MCELCDSCLTYCAHCVKLVVVASKANCICVFVKCSTANKLGENVMSAGLSSGFALRIVVSLLLTSCCMKRCRNAPSLIAIDFAALLSVYILMLVRTSNASLMKLLM